MFFWDQPQPTDLIDLLKVIQQRPIWESQMPFAGTQQVDLSALVNVIQGGNSILNAILAALAGGIAIQPKLTVYPTVAGLPTVGIAVGQIGYVANGRKPAEGPGAGTGVPVWFNVSGVWFAMTSGVAVTA